MKSKQTDSRFQDYHFLTTDNPQKTVDNIVKKPKPGKRKESELTDEQKRELDEMQRGKDGLPF